MAHNQFEPLRRPGIVGQVAYHNFDYHTIWSRGQSLRTPAQSVAVITAQIAPGKWAIGLNIISGSHNDKVLPGEMPGWFASKEDALLYALDFARLHRYCPEEAKYTILQRINTIRNRPLF